MAPAGELEELARGLGLFGLEAQTGGEAPDARSVGWPWSGRRRARRRDFDEADRLREAIEAEGWEVQDVADGFRLIPKA